MVNEFQPTEAELEILQVIWQHQPCTIGLIQEQISKKREIGYTTISKQVERMTEKQMLERTKDGKTISTRQLSRKRRCSAPCPNDLCKLLTKELPSNWQCTHLDKCQFH
ncbi:MAG: BlaI/MecI/CopY family transcriptional regulator [Saprospiraceae bacterium]|nr:BlaI/MecI/CopY family transcriptional regulator [Saprospiraceae bacterium]